jgi:hypothetical protein
VEGSLCAQGPNVHAPPVLVNPVLNRPFSATMGVWGRTIREMVGNFVAYGPINHAAGDLCNI